MHGLLDVRFKREGEKTLARVAEQRSPLKALRPFYPEGTSPSHLYILNVTGGVLEGDRIDLTLHLSPFAEALVTAPSATKVHAMPSGFAEQKTHITLEHDSVLEYVPEPLIPFADSAFFQNIDIFLEENASLFWIDILASGRLARGESFSYRVYENRMKIRDGEGLISLEAYCIKPEHEAIDGIGVMEGYSHLGSLYLFCAEKHVADLLNQFRLIEYEEDLCWGITLLSRRGLVVRALAFETPILQAFFTRLWGLFRKEVMGRSLPPLRRY